MSKVPVANKQLGQHYLKDQNVIKKICTNFSEQAEVIIEIGPGPGVLTQQLAATGKPLYLIEKDTRFRDILLNLCPEDHVYFTDAMDFYWEEFFKKHQLHGKKIWLVSNLPYNISSQLFISFITLPDIAYMTLMFQKEVAEKIAPPLHQKNSMSSLAVYGHLFFETKLLVKVSPGAFLPPPKVDSQVLSFIRHQNIAEVADFKNLEKFSRILFSQKRKQLGTVLKALAPIEKLTLILERCKISPQIRAEALDVKEVLALYHELKAE
ncbi:MAG: ribosomal RNA small subunit methyltransferase A [Bacteriovoracaceae bacterium]|nr:ribosomal RNA small subunit methyltransferase A [Bacteriovoracaceae bacterium]